MNVDALTTPFGARGLSAAMLRAHDLAENCPEKAAIGKWLILRDLTVARHRFALSDRAVTVLSALLSFFPDDDLSGDTDLLVFPSNAELMRRAHGISEATLRRCLQQLVEAGLVLRRDSPNGKRYARRNADGSIGKAFGFDLKPLLAQAPAIQAASAAIRAEARAITELREQVTLLRRDIRKLVAFTFDGEVSADWAMLLTAFRPLDGASNRGLGLPELTALRNELVGVRLQALKLLKTNNNSENMDGNDRQTERHKHDSNQTPFSDLELADENSKGGEPTDRMSGSEDATAEFDKPVGADGVARARRRSADASAGQPPRRAKIPLDLVLRACPDIRDYAKHEIRNWGDLQAAAALVRSVLGVSPDAWAEAEAIMGPDNAAATLAAILQRAGQIRSPGGYLRSLSERAANGGYSPAPAIAALLRH